VLGVLVRVAIRFVLAAALAAVGVLVINHLGDDPPRTGSAQGQNGRVIRVADGDTVTVRVGRRDLHVRLLGIDAPEATTLRFGRADCGGQAASRHLRRLAIPAGHGIGVRVRTDPASGDVRDKYGRTLAYLDGPRGDLGEAQLRAGQAVVYRYRRRRFSRLARYRAAQTAARRARRGTWAACHRPLPHPATLSSRRSQPVRLRPAP
jgi:endonuclease YncB( thermonuclease family)